MKLGIIGGSGIYGIDGFGKFEDRVVETPFGLPSDKFHCGELNGREVVFLARHGAGHRLLPGELNHRANIFGMKKLGVTHLLSISAVGSLKDGMKPRDIVIVDQYFDRTRRGIENTFFGNGIAAHIAFGDPVCPELSAAAADAAESAVEKGDFKEGKTPAVHRKGTYVNMEGPAFSTRAESNFYRKMGMDVIGMTNMAEAKLAREAEICYSTVAMVTDYDCWHSDHEHVTVEMIIGNLLANASLAEKIILNIIPAAAMLERNCACARALDSAIITSPENIPEERKKALEPIIGAYI